MEEVAHSLGFLGTTEDEGIILEKDVIMRSVDGRENDRKQQHGQLERGKEDSVCISGSEHMDAFSYSSTPLEQSQLTPLTAESSKYRDATRSASSRRRMAIVKYKRLWNMYSRATTGKTRSLKKTDLDARIRAQRAKKQQRPLSCGASCTTKATDKQVLEQRTLWRTLQLHSDIDVGAVEERLHSRTIVGLQGARQWPARTAAGAIGDFGKGCYTNEGHTKPVDVPVQAVRKKPSLQPVSKVAAPLSKQVHKRHDPVHQPPRSSQCRQQVEHGDEEKETIPKSNGNSPSVGLASSDHTMPGAFPHLATSFPPLPSLQIHSCAPASSLSSSLTLPPSYLASTSQPCPRWPTFKAACGMSSRPMSKTQNHRRTTVPERYHHLDDLYPRLLPRPRIRQRTRLAASNVEDLFDPSSAPAAAGYGNGATLLLRAVESLQKRVLGSRGVHDGDKNRLFKKALDRALDTGILGWVLRHYHHHHHHHHCHRKHQQQQYRAQGELREEEWHDKALMTGFGMSAQKRRARFLAWRTARWQRQARLRQRRDKDLDGWQNRTMTTTMARWRRRRKKKGQSRKRGEMTMMQLLQRNASSMLAWLKRGGSRGLWTVFKLLAKVSPIVKTVLEELFSERSVEQVEWRMFVREEDEMGTEDEDDLIFEEGEDEEEKGSDEDDDEVGEDHEEEYLDDHEEEYLDDHEEEKEEYGRVRKRPRVPEEDALLDNRHSRHPVLRRQGCRDCELGRVHPYCGVDLSTISRAEPKRMRYV